MQSHGGNVYEKREKKNHPPTLKFAVGDKVVAIATEIKRDVQTPFGISTIVEVKLRGKGNADRFSIFWKDRLPLPQLNQVFIYGKVTEKIYKLWLTDNAEEGEKVWKDGPPADLS